MWQLDAPRNHLSDQFHMLGCGQRFEFEASRDQVDKLGQDAVIITTLVGRCICAVAQHKHHVVGIKPGFVHHRGVAIILEIDDFVFDQADQFLLV